MNEEIIIYDNDKLVEIKEFVDIVADKMYRRRLTKTPYKLIKTRKGKGRNTEYKYITRTTAMQWLDKNFPGWSMRVIPESFKETAGLFQVAVELKVLDPLIGMKERVIVCYGSNEIQTKTDGQGNKLLDENGREIPIELTFAKNAETDALKRCVFTLGGFKDVYTEEEERIEISEKDLYWFLCSIYPIIKSKTDEKLMKPSAIFELFNKYYNNDITKEQLIKIYNIKEE